MYLFLKYLHIIGAIILVGSVVTIDLMTLRLILSRKNPGLKVFYLESKFIERGIIAPSSILTLLSGIIMASLWFGWPFWMDWGIIVIAFTGFTGSVTIPKIKKRLTHLISDGSPNEKLIKRLVFKFVIQIGLDLILLFSVVGTMIYKPVF